jgi:hypothetical protein
VRATAAGAPADAAPAVFAAAVAAPAAPALTGGYRASLLRLGAAYFMPEHAAQRRELLKQVLPQALGEQVREKRRLLLAADPKGEGAAAEPEGGDADDAAPEPAAAPSAKPLAKKPRRSAREYERIRAPMMQP